MRRTITFYRRSLETVFPVWGDGLLFLSFFVQRLRNLPRDALPFFLILRPRILTRRIDALNKRMLDLVNETVAAGKDVESSEDEFKGISDQIEQLNRRIAAIQEIIHKDDSRQARLEEIQSIIAKRGANETQHDDSIVRQMIECIKVHNDGKLTIIFGGGYEIEEAL